MDIISFSIWGDNDKYIKGAIENVIASREIYPDWYCRFYLRDDVPYLAEEALIECGAQVIRINPPYRGEWEGLYWRFYPISEIGMDRFISRDTDSIVNWREKAAVDEWIASGELFHIMRDNNKHTTRMLGGMWGCVGGVIPNIVELINKYAKFDKKGVDQEFLAEYIWPYVINNHIAHDEIHQYSGNRARPFPPHKFTKVAYVGEIIER